MSTFARNAILLNEVYFENLIKVLQFPPNNDLQNPHRTKNKNGEVITISLGCIPMLEVANKSIEENLYFKFYPGA